MLGWLESIRYKEEGWGRFKYNLHMIRDYGLTPSLSSLGIMNRFGAVDSISNDQRKEMIMFLVSCFDPQDKLFKDPLITEQDISGNHTWEHITLHISAGVPGALRTLGFNYTGPGSANPPFIDLRTGNAYDKVKNLAWENPWMVGEHFTRALRWYWDQLPENEKSLENPVVKDFFQAYEDNVLDSATGMPLKRGCKRPTTAMAGLFKVYGAYSLAGRIYPHADKAIDYVLKLQFKDGSFGDEFTTNSPMTINWDAIWVLRVLDIMLKGSYRHNEIKTSGNRLAEYLMKVHRKPDGAFSFHKDHCLTAHNSIKTSEKYRESDTLGTGMCLNCLSYADEWNAEF